MPSSRCFRSFGQALVGGVHVAELSVAQRLAVAVRNLHAVEHVGERDHVAVRHVGVPVLPRVGQADGLAVLHDVGQHHDLGQPRLLVGAGHVDLQAPEARRERAQLRGREVLLRVAQHAVAAECLQQLLEYVVRQRLRKVEVLDARAERGAAGNDAKWHACFLGRVL
jgi:hypothetical protein